MAKSRHRYSQQYHLERHCFSMNFLPPQQPLLVSSSQLSKLVRAGHFFFGGIRYVLILLLMPCSLFAAQTRDTQAAIVDYFGVGSTYPHLQHTKGFTSVEICFDSTCDFYRFASTTDENVIWDLVFLHQYFVSPAFHIEQFKEKYHSLARNVVARYRRLCSSSTEEQLPICMLRSLAKQHEVSYAFVRYDEGFRCQVVGRIANPKFEGRSSCRKYQSAP